MPQQTITTTPSQVLSKNPYRRSIVFHNPSVNVIFVNPSKPGGMTVTNAGIRIPSLGSRTINWFDDGGADIVREWSAISDTGSNTLEFREFSDAGMAIKGFNITKNEDES